MKHAITVYECEIAAIRAANEERKKNGEDATVRAARRFVEMVEKDVEALRKRITEKEKKVSHSLD